MNNRLGLGLAVGAGYLLGRTKKLKFAFAVGTFVAGKKLQLSPKALMDFASSQLQNNPQFKEIGDQLREDMRGVGKAATGAIINRQLGGLADRLHSSTLNVQDKAAGIVPDITSLKDQDKGRDEEQDEEPEEETEEREQPRRQTRKRAASSESGPSDSRSSESGSSRSGSSRSGSSRSGSSGSASGSRTAGKTGSGTAKKTASGAGAAKKTASRTASGTAAKKTTSGTAKKTAGAAKKTASRGGRGRG
ncbi:DNA primase [Streptomyces sp. NPDC051561]|uniref:DNA primase n=1 Tax=Streptomyces sp. NPDC051561 TaxID=3365658 RepID=UPI0037A7444E